MTGMGSRMSRPRRRYGALGILLAALVGGVPAQAGNSLEADLSSREIAISTGFTGSELLLFGSVDGDGDIVVVVRGPLHREVVRRKARVAGVWVNKESMLFRDVPAYYHVASTRPLVDIAAPAVLTRMELGAGRLRLPRIGPASTNDGVFRAALLRNKQRDRLYSRGQGEIKMLGRRLFRTTVVFPTIVRTGTYSVAVHLFRDGRVVDTKTTPLDVRKVGLEAEIYNFAQQNSALYGIIAILVALMAGWLAGAIFRKA
jgi:uncharacterized protein (TIGR02186 family)